MVPNEYLLVFCFFSGIGLGCLIGSALASLRGQREVTALRRVCGELYGEVKRLHENEEWWAGD